MKFCQLDLIAYGPFTETSIDLLQGDHGLHIVYGPNEGGKSTSLRAIRGLLFGIPHKCSDDFLHSKLRIGGAIENAAGDVLWFHRRKGRTKTILNPETQVALPDTSLDDFLNGSDEELFQRVFCIGHEELEKGGEEMAALRGRIGESLFAATVGGPGLSSLLSKLDAEAEQLYSASKRKVKIKQAIVSHKESKRRLRDLQVTKSKFENLKRERKKADETLDAVKAAKLERDKELSRCQRLADALGEIATRNSALAVIHELHDAIILPEEYDVAVRSSVQTNQTNLRAQITDLKKEIEGENGLAQQVEKILVPVELLQQRGLIGDLHKQCIEQQKAQSDKVGLQRAIDEMRRESARRLRDLGLEPDANVGQLEKFRLRSDEVLQLQSLGNDEKGLRKRRQQLQADRQKIEKDIKQNQSQLKAAGQPSNVVELEDVVEEIRDWGDVDGDVESSEAERNADELAINQRLASIGLWIGKWDDLPALPLPNAKTIEVFDARFDECDASERENGTAISQNRKKSAEARQAILTLEKQGHVPTEVELHQRRSQRDDCWRDVRQQLVNEKGTRQPTAGLAKLAAEFERSVETSDRLADRLRREATRVAELAQQQAKLEELERQSLDLGVQAASHVASRDQLNSEWQLLWVATGISAPLAIAEMRAWLDDIRDVKKDAAKLQKVQNRLKDRRKKQSKGCKRLNDALELAGVTSKITVVEDGNRYGLKSLLVRANRFIKEQTELQSQRSEWTQRVEIGQGQSRDCLAQVTKAEEEWKEWKRQWVPFVERIGCRREASADQMNERLKQLDALFTLFERLAEKAGRLQHIEENRCEFASLVAPLAERFLATATTQDPFELSRQLDIVLQQAVADERRRDQLNETLEQRRQQLADLERELTEVSCRVKEFCAMAGVSDVDHLSAVERGSAKLKGSRQRLAEVEERLRSLSGGEDLEAFIEDAARHDTDELHARIKQLIDDIHDLIEQRDKAVACVSALKAEDKSIDGSAAAAEIDEKMLGELAGIQSDAAEYIKLRLAATMLRLQVEHHRAHNQDPLLARASLIFARLTCKEFSGLQIEYDESDQPVIGGVRADSDTILRVHAMSDGTRNQLFLALRLAYVEKMLSQSEPMPFIVDDILIQFDDERSGATLEVLAKLSKRTQVIFFTHHQHLVELAESTISDDVFVHHLDSRGRPDPRRPKASTLFD